MQLKATILQSLAPYLINLTKVVRITWKIAGRCVWIGIRGVAVQITHSLVLYHGFRVMVSLRFGTCHVHPISMELNSARRWPSSKKLLIPGPMVGVISIWKFCFDSLIYFDCWIFEPQHISSLHEIIATMDFSKREYFYIHSTLCY